MRGRTVGSVFSALLALCLALALPVPAAAAGTGSGGSIEVVVLDGNTPVPYAVVLMNGGHSGRTDQNGRITFTGLAYGEYTVAVATAQTKGGSGTAAIDQAHPNGSITVAVSAAWPVPAAGMKSPAPCGACQASSPPSPPLPAAPATRPPARSPAGSAPPPPPVRR